MPPPKYDDQNILQVFDIYYSFQSQELKNALIINTGKCVYLLKPSTNFIKILHQASYVSVSKFQIS